MVSTWFYQQVTTFSNIKKCESVRAIFLFPKWCRTRFSLQTNPNYSSHTSNFSFNWWCCFIILPVKLKVAVRTTSPLCSFSCNMHQWSSQSRSQGRGGRRERIEVLSTLGRRVPSGAFRWPTEWGTVITSSDDIIDSRCYIGKFRLYYAVQHE